jgi:phage-related protein
MSREVDQRVVEMRFDNAQFEKNTRESMKTLDRLQEKLQFKDVDKGFENIEKAQRNVNFDEMEGALDTLKVKFNALDVMAVAALTNITNKIVDTGERLVKSLSVDQVASGWNKYIEKTSNVQTIMNATGESIDNVNGYLNKLMWYSDETSYSFSEMTSALSQMTAAGGDIKKMIPMIMGIANATADAGKTGFAFQSTIRNLTQSYSAGHLQLQDWKSLNLMGTATKALKQELIDTAVEMGKLKEGEVTIATFESTLSKKWADTKVMEKTFEKYASMMEAAYDMVQQNPGMTSSEALEKLSGQYGELAERAALAAQQATSFEQAIDSTKDAVSSSWMKVFETFFGNKEEATETWTELANRLYDIFVPSIDALNERLKEGLDTGWKQLNDKLGDQAETYDTVLQKVALASGAVTEESIEEAGSFANALRDGGVNAELLQNGLDVTLVSLEKYLAMSDEELDARNLDKEAIERDYEALSRLNEEFRTGEASLADYAAGMSELSGREHLMQSLWNIMDALSALVQPIHDAFQEIFPPTSGKQIKSFAEGLDYATSKLIIGEETATKIRGAFTGLFRVIRVGTDTIAKVVKTAVKLLGGLADVLKPVKDSILDVAGGFGDFVTEVGEALTGTKTLGERFDTIRASLKKLLSPLGDLKDLAKNFSLAGLKEQLDALVQSGGNLSWISGLSENAQKVLKPLIVLAGQAAGGGLTLLGVLGAVAGGVIAKLGETADFLKKWVKGQLDGADSLETTLTNLPVKIGEAVTTFATTFKKNISSIEATADTVVDPVKKFFEALKVGFDSISGTDVYRLLSLIDVGLLAFSIGQFAKAMNSLKKMLQTPLTGMLDSISGTFKQLTSAIKTWQKNNASKTLVSMASAVLILAGAMYVMSRIDPDRFKSVAAVTMLSIVLLAGAAKLLEPTAKKFDKAFDSLKSSMLNAATLWGTAAALIGLGVAVGSIAKGLSNLVAALNEGDIAANAAALAIAAAAVVALMLAMGELSKALVIGEKVINHKVLLSTVAEMIALGTAIKIVSTALEPLSKIKFASLAKAGLAVVSLGGLLTSMATVLAAVQKLIGPTGFQNGAAIAAMASGIWIAAQAVSSIANIKRVNLDAAMTSIKTLMLLITTMSALSAKTKFTSGAAIFMMSSSLIVLAGAVELFAVMGDEAIDGLIKVSAGLTALSIASQAAGADGAMAIMAMSTAMLVLAGAVAVYEKLGDGAWSAMLKCGVALAGMYVAVFALSKMSGDALQAAWTINTLSTGMIKLAAACVIFNVVNWDALKVAAVALGGLIAILFGAGWLATKLPVVSVGFTALATAFDKFASAALKLAGATAILGVLSMFAGPICQAIINAAPDIEQALVAVINMLCNVIMQCAGPLVKAFDALVRAVVPVLWQELKDALGFLGVPETWEELADATWNAIKTAFAPFKGNGLFQQRNIVFKANPDYQPQRVSITDWFNTKDANDDAEKAGNEVGEHYVNGNVTGMTKNAYKAADAGADLVSATDESVRKKAGIESPSRLMAENGRWMALGLAEGLLDEGAVSSVLAAANALCTRLDDHIRNFWGIHSPSDVSYAYGEYIDEGAANGIENGTGAVTDAVDKQSQEVERHYSDYRTKLVQAAQDGMTDVSTTVTGALDDLQTTAGEKARGVVATVQTALSGMGLDTSKWGEGIANFTSSLNFKDKGGISPNGLLFGLGGQTVPDMLENGVDIDAMYQKTKDKFDEITRNTGKKPKGGGSSKNTKTEADKLVDEYTKKLKANKAKMDAADKEYALWELTEGDTSSVEALVEKKTDSLTQAIADQTDRVAIAKKQYDKILAEKSSTDTQKSDAYATYLDEEKTLAELKGKKQATLFQVIKDRYDDEASTATDEYELWASLYEDTATVEEKSNKKIENLNKKIGIQAKVVTAAEEEYTTLKAEFGEESLKTQEAYRQWLEEQKEQQDLINEMNQAQLDAFDDALAMLEKQEKIITNRQNVLKKIYNDGDLSQREEAYKAAVKQYGADSKEARLASTQGTMTAILGVGTALDSMAYSVKKLTNKQNKYNEAVKQSGKDSEAALDALAEWQGEQYNFVGFVEDLATAFDLDDSGKRMTMQLGYAIARNWKPIQKGFQDVWQKVQTKFPQAAQNMANAFGLVVREGATEVITDVYSMITAAVGGDWGQALTSGIAAVLDFMGSDFGKTVLDTVGPMLATAGKKLSGTLAATLGGVVSEGGLLTTIGTKLAGLAATIGGEGGILATVGAKLAALAASLGPHGLLIAAVVAAGAVVITLLVKNWDKVKNFFGRALDWLRNLFSKFVEVGKNLVKGLWEGITGAAKAVGDGIKNLCTGLVNRVKSFFGIHSPSTVMAQLGEYMSLGFANGIADSGNAVDRSMNDVMRSALSAAQMSADMILSCFDEDADFSPTITPVVDLEGVRNSANWMQSAFADPDGTLNARFEQPTQLMRSFAKRREIQNGEPTAAAASGNDDVVAAIESLGSRVDAVSEAVRNMKLSIDRRKLVGEIIEDVDTKLMERAERRRR